MNIVQQVNGELVFAALESGAAGVIDFAARLHAKDYSAGRLLVLEGPPSSGVTRVARAIPDANGSAVEGRDDPAATFEQWGEELVIVNVEALQFSDVDEFDQALADALIPAAEGGRRFVVLYGREVNLRPDYEAAAIRIQLVAAGTLLRSAA